MLRYADYDIVFQEIPDEVTLAINLSNCPNHCKGCHSAYLMEDVGEPLTEESLSGKSKLPEHFDVSHFQYIKLGPYIESLGGLKSETTNQRLYHIENGIMEDITYRFLPHHSKKIS